MFYRNTLKVAIMAATCVASLDTFADEPPQYDNEVGVGVQGVFGTNANQAGRYNGLNVTGADLVGQFAYRGRYSDDAQYFNATGDNLVFQFGSALPHNTFPHNGEVNNGSVGINFGRQGTWETGLSYDSITYTGNVIDSIYTVNGATATLNPSLKAWGGATATAPGTIPSSELTIPVLTASGAMQPVQTGTRRDIFDGNFKYFNGDWSFIGAFRHEHKQGSLEESYFGPFQGVAFALPIDYTTERYDAAVAWTTPVNQASLQYTFSHFQDDYPFVSLPYPFTNTSLPYQLSAAYSTPPSNTAQYLTFQAATNAVPNTRINVNLRGGLEFQDDTFPPNTADPNVTGAPGYGNLNPDLQGTSAGSPHAQAKIFQAKVNVYSTPATNMDVNAYWGYDHRNVSINQYKVTSGNEGGESDSGFTSFYYVVPQDWTKWDAGVDVGYRIYPQTGTKLTVSYRYDSVSRSNAQVDSSNTNTFDVKLLSQVGPVYGNLSYEYQDRSGSINYLTPWAALAGTNNTGLAWSGAYYQAPMTSNAIKLMADYSPMPILSTNLFLQWKEDDYTYSSTSVIGTNIPPITGVGGGVKNDSNFTISPSVNYRPSDDMRVHLFYTFEQIYFNNIGNGSCSTAAQVATPGCAGSAGYFQNKYTSNINTIGVSGDWKVNEKLMLGAEYTFAYGSVMYGQFNGVFVPVPTQSYQNVSNYPDIKSRMDMLKLTAVYKVMAQADLLLQATWSKYSDDNFNDYAASIQGSGTTAVGFLTPGYGPPNYNVGTIMGGVRIHF